MWMRETEGEGKMKGKRDRKGDVVGGERSLSTSWQLRGRETDKVMEWK